MSARQLAHVLTGGVHVNERGQPVGASVPGWTPRPTPAAAVLAGRYCRLERLDADRHAGDLFAADQLDRDGRSWTYLPYGPFADLDVYRRWMQWAANSSDPLFYAVLVDSPDQARPSAARAVGVLSYLRIHPEHGAVEVGHVHYSPLLARTRAATEAQYLLMAHAFDDLGYRRYEWKCDALNAASRSAATRLGFTYEGTFRQAAVVKGRSRDTAWYSVIDSDWPALRSSYRRWLNPNNFTENGLQRSPLQAE